MKYTLVALILVVTSLTAAMDQEPKRMKRTISSDNAVIIREIGAVITPKEEQLIVEIILGNHEKTDTDIKKGDIILMANGKRVKTVKELRQQYDNANVGEEFKLGVKRDEHLLLVKFERKSDEELNKTGGGMVMRMEQKEGEVILPALGVKLATKDNAVVIIETLPTLSHNFRSNPPKAGDIILSINGHKVSSAEEFDDAYTELNEGDTVTILFSRNGKENKETFAKPKPMGRRMMITR
jgi:S1-C subfamily serine protease